MVSILKPWPDRKENVSGKSLRKLRGHVWFTRLLGRPPIPLAGFYGSRRYAFSRLFPVYGDVSDLGAGFPPGIITGSWRCGPRGVVSDAASGAGIPRRTLPDHSHAECNLLMNHAKGYPIIGCVIALIIITQAHMSCSVCIVNCCSVLRRMSLLFLSLSLFNGRHGSGSRSSRPGISHDGGGPATPCSCTIFQLI